MQTLLTNTAGSLLAPRILSLYEQGTLSVTNLGEVLHPLTLRMVVPNARRARPYEV